MKRFCIYQGRIEGIDGREFLKCIKKQRYCGFKPAGATLCDEYKPLEAARIWDAKVKNCLDGACKL